MGTIDHPAGGVREVVTPGGVTVGGVSPSASVPVPPGGVRAGGFAPVEVIGPFLVAYVAVTHDSYHLLADHDDPIAYGTELALVVALIFVGGRLVLRRLLRPS